MLNKIKYVLFDFSENFKNDFVNLFKKTAILLALGIILFLVGCISSSSDIFAAIGSIGMILMVIFGFIWGRNFTSVTSLFQTIQRHNANNIIINLFCIVFSFLFSLVIGFIYFIWCVVKMIIYTIKSKNQ